MVKTRLTIILSLLVVFSLPAIGKDGTKTAGARFDPQASTREGRRLFLESGCMSCHSVSGKGGTTGPDLAGIGARRTRAFIESKIRDPRAHPNIKVSKGKAPKGKAEKPKSKMIQADLFEDQIRQLADYLMTLPADKPSGTH